MIALVIIMKIKVVLWIDLDNFLLSVKILKFRYDSAKINLVINSNDQRAW